MFVSGIDVLVFSIWHFCCGLQELEKLNEELQLIDKDMEAQTQKTEFDNVTLSEEGTVCL